MSYIRAHQVNRDRTNPFSDFTHVQRADLDANLDDEMLGFIIALIGRIDELPEGEALVVWKEIF